jgi:hypothetical protein
LSVEIDLMPDPVRRGLARHGPIGCAQSALITVDDRIFEQIWTPSTLELLARSYWRFLTRRSFGMVRTSYREGARKVAVAGVPLLRFRSPEFETGADFGSVSWPIDRGLLVAPAGRGEGYLKIEVRHSADRQTRPGTESITVTSEVVNFYPWIRGSGWFARLGTWLYSQTQLRVHIWLTRGFLRSLRDLPDEVIVRGEDPGSDPDG